jgi:carbonic anhydrase/acetyltransferase-like protein (isoleucine patch superfamily)
VKTYFKKLYQKIDTSFPSIGSLIGKIFPRKSFFSNKHIIRGSNNTLSYHEAVVSSTTFDIEGDDNKIDIKEDCVLRNVTFNIRGSGHRVVIGRGCRFKQGGSIRFEDSNGLLMIGERSTFENAHLAITEPNSRITIGEDCMFASDIVLRTGDSHSIISQENNQRLNYAEDIKIGNHVWIADNCTLLKGSAIPDNSVIATGSVVTKKYKTQGIIIGGNPAKQIKEGITWSKKRDNRTR